jgi:hypothetical protein
VTEGRCYHITARGRWANSRGAACGPDGVCPTEALTILGPQPSLTTQQKRDWYLGQHPRSALITRIGDEKWDMFIGAEAFFMAPVSGKLSFRMNDAAEGAATGTAQRGGKLDVSINEFEPKWLDARGTAAIYARLDATDFLHITPDGLYWEYGGSWGKVGEHDGHYPTLINGIQWWPKWTSKTRTEALAVKELKLTGRVQLVRVEAKRGNVKIEQSAAGSAASGGEVVLEFSDGGLGSSQVGCIVKFSR